MIYKKNQDYSLEEEHHLGILHSFFSNIHLRYIVYHSNKANLLPKCHAKPFSKTKCNFAWLLLVVMKGIRN